MHWLNPVPCISPCRAWKPLDSRFFAEYGWRAREVPIRRRRCGSPKRLRLDAAGGGFLFFGDEAFQFFDGAGGAVFGEQPGAGGGGGLGVRGVAKKAVQRAVEVFRPAAFAEAEAAAEAFD